MQVNQRHCTLSTAMLHSQLSQWLGTIATTTQKNKKNNFLKKYHTPCVHNLYNSTGFLFNTCSFTACHY